METMNQIAQSFGYIIITFMVLFGLFLWRMMKKAPTYDDMEENRIMGLTDRITELEKEKENLKGDYLRAKAKQAEAEINLATANMLKAVMQNELNGEQQKNDKLQKENESLKKENETLRQDNKITVEALFQKEADIDMARKRASLMVARMVHLLDKNDFTAILELANETLAEVR